MDIRIENNSTKNRGMELAEWWLARGFFLLPVQPNSKQLVTRFGPHQRVITTLSDASKWFASTSVNMAVCGTQTSLILDFDDAQLYREWVCQFPAETQTYTERTPRGYHVFGHVWGDDLKGVQLVPGVELKTVCLVAPSVIGDRVYCRGTGEILDLDAQRLLSPLSKAPAVVPSRPAAQLVTGGSLVQQIKAKFSCLDLLGAKGNGQKRFVTLPCPLHNDDKPSFWIDQTRNLWGCHACGVRGDVINLYARLNNLTVREAIKAMEKTL